MKYNLVQSNFLDVRIEEPTEFVNCSCRVINTSDKPIWIKFSNSSIKAKTDHPFMMDYFANYPHSFNIPILPETGSHE